MSFQDELNKATRTPSEAASSKHNEEFTNGMDLAESSYREIKEQLLEMAQDGKFSYKNGKKQIVLYYKNYWVQSDFKLDRADTSVNKTFFNPKGSHAYRMYYTATNPSHFDGFMSRLKEFCAPDNISVRAIGYYNFYDEDVYEFDIAGSLTGQIFLENHFSVRIKCTVDY